LNARDIHEELERLAATIERFQQQRGQMQRELDELLRVEANRWQVTEGRRRELRDELAAADDQLGYLNNRAELLTAELPPPDAVAKARAEIDQQVRAMEVAENDFARNLSALRIILETARPVAERIVASRKLTQQAGSKSQQLAAEYGIENDTDCPPPEWRGPRLDHRLEKLFRLYVTLVQVAIDGDRIPGGVLDDIDRLSKEIPPGRYAPIPSAEEVAA
jgi:hypothetical protein